MSRLDLDLITPGIELYTALERMRDADGMPIGGVVVAIFDDRDHETGEIRRRFRCIDPSRPGGSHLSTPLVAEADVDPDTIRPASRNRISVCILRLSTWLQRGRDGRRRAAQHAALSPEQQEWAHWIGELEHALGAMR